MRVSSKTKRERDYNAKQIVWSPGLTITKDIKIIQKLGCNLHPDNSTY